MAERRDGGVALILVMTVVLALSLIAVPFVFSMLLQERMGTAARQASQAEYGAEGARNYAAWRLMRGVDFMERRHPAGDYSTYFHDGPAEFRVPMRDMYLSPQSVLNPQGSIWGVTLQDEQGKIDVRTVPPAAVARLQGLMANQLSDPKDYLTLYAGRGAAWIHPQRIRGLGDVRLVPDDPSSAVYVLAADSAAHYGRGARLRVTKPGLPPVEVVVSRNYLVDTGANHVETTPQVPGQYIHGTVEVEGRHPVNVNTARRETLMALFEGCRHVAQQEGVDRRAAQDLAEMVADAVADKGLTRWEDFWNLVMNSKLSDAQKAAVITNASDPTSAYLEGTGTAGVCFSSFDVCTIDAASSVNSPAGAQTAGTGFREVVSVSPPDVLTLHLESQHDFESSMESFGNRWVTFPNMPPLSPDTTLKPKQTADTEAYLQLATGRDERGQGAYDSAIQPREHFDDTQEGVPLKGGARTYPWNAVLTTMPYPAPGDPLQQHPDVASGGFEMWVRFDTVGNPMTIFDLRENDSSNRLSLHAENGELIFTACDATMGDSAAAGSYAPIDNGAAEVRMPFLPVTDTWYHLGAYWKGTRYALLGLLVDGFAHPQQEFRHVSPAGDRLYTKLTSDITDTTDPLPLESDGWFPNDPVALEIGDEVVVVDKGDGLLFRGQRGTTAKSHPSGARVSLFGYSSKVRSGTVTYDGGQQPVTMTFDRITTGGGKLANGFGANPIAIVAGNVQDSQTLMWYVDDVESDIAVNSGDIGQFPDQGYLVISQEVVFYTGRSTGGVNGQGDSKFTGCSRGEHGTTAAQHYAGETVTMWGIPATDTRNYLTPTVIQIGFEPIGPVHKDTVRPGYWIPPVVSGIPDRLRRAALGSIPMDHAKGDKVLPMFLVRESDPNVSRLNLGIGDVATLVDASNAKEQQRIAGGWAETSDYVFNVSGGQLAAFDDFVSREILPDGLHVRVLKFPSGELAGLSFLESANPNFTVGPLDATVDEIKFFAAPREDRRIGGDATSADGVMSVSGGGLAQVGGVFKAGDEYVGYGNFQSGSADRLKRGWLNSKAELHAQGDRVFYLSFLPVSTLLQDVGPEDFNLRLRRSLWGQNPGYALIDDELVLCEWGGIGMPVRKDGVTGLFRGMFGTVPAAHVATSSLVYGLPWRFFDTYKAQEFDNRMAYYQWSTRMEMAQWRSVLWRQEVPQGDSNIVVHALARVDGKGDFADPPASNGDVLLWDFTSPQVRNEIRKVGYRNDPGQFDLRFLVEYRPGSFDAQQPWSAHSWKRAPKIKEVQIDYDRPTRVLYHEDR